jgi:hypothetical protein
MAVLILFCNPKRMKKRLFNSDYPVSRVSFRVKIQALHYPECIADLNRANYGSKCLRNYTRCLLYVNHNLETKSRHGVIFITHNNQNIM